MAKVLLAIDDSEHSIRAFEYYVDNVHRPGNSLVFVHCKEIPFQPVQPLRAEIVQDLIQKVDDEAQELEDKFKKLADDKEIPYEIIADFGKPGELICDHASKSGASLVVLGTRGMGTVRRTILGSVSDHVVHHAHCPVLVVRK